MASLLLDSFFRGNILTRVKARSFLGIFLALISASVYAGIYQRTRHTHVLVWNDHPNSFQEVTWSGGKDGAGYAEGYGTLTWYAPEKPPLTGSTIPSRRKMIVVSQQTGTMEHGKFVNTAKARNAKPKTRAERQKNSQTPTPVQSEQKEQSPAPAKESSPSPTATPSPAPPTPAAIATPHDEPINSLTRPPSSLQLSSPEATPASPHPTESASPSPQS